jgi:hypothetical protein
VGEASEVAVSDTVRETVRAVRELLENGEDVTRNTLAKKFGIVPTSAGRRFAPATAAGYVKEDPDNPNAKPKRYVLGDVSLPENVEVIPNPERLRSCVGASGARGGGTSGENRASDDFDNARSGASVRAPSADSVAADDYKPHRNGKLSEGHDNDGTATGVSQDRTHARTIFEDETDGTAENDIVHASVRDGCMATNPPFITTDGPIDGRVHVRAEDYERCDVCSHEDYEVCAQHHEGGLTGPRSVYHSQ